MKLETAVQSANFCVYYPFVKLHRRQASNCPIC